MDEDDLKLIISKYQQKVFELFNTNIVLETQIEKLTKNTNLLNLEIEKLKKQKRGQKLEGDFE
jgi:hypothetical protein